MNLPALIWMLILGASCSAFWQAWTAWGVWWGVLYFFGWEIALGYRLAGLPLLPFLGISR